MKDKFQDPARFISRTTELVTEQRAIEGERYRLTDGRVFERSHIPVTLPTGDGSVWIYEDITGQIQQETDLGRYETIVQTFADPVCSLSSDGQFTFVNQAFTDVTGYSQEKLLGEHASAVL